MKGFKIDKIVFHSEGFKEILNSPGVKGLVESQTSAICARANANVTKEGSKGYKSEVKQGSRWYGVVYSTNWDSYKDETENKALSRAVR